MKFVRWARFSIAIFSIATFFFLSQSGWPVAGPGVDTSADTSLPEASSAIERGGTVTAIDRDKKTISVDGIAYPLGYAPVVVHNGGASGSAGVFGLKQGTKIRFTTTRDINGRHRVTEVWVVHTMAK